MNKPATRPRPFTDTKYAFVLFLFLVSTYLAFGQQPLAGELPGEVTHTHSGGSTYEIAMELSPSRKGLHPRVSLNYNSHSGQDIAGVGWHVNAGVSSISRSAKSFEYDQTRSEIQFNSQDPFSLDGNRLMLVEGTHGAHGAVYFTHLETYQRVEIIDTNPSIPGPDGFLVQTASGLHKYYGTSDDARVHQSSENGPVLTWLLKTVIDQDGNKMEYAYWNCPDSSFFCSDQGTNKGYALKSVTYNLIDGQSPAYFSTVRFYYQDRPDHRHHFRHGVPFSFTRRLSQIKVFVNDDGDLNGEEAEDLYRHYLLSYETAPITGFSRLTEVQVRNGSGDTFPPTTFQYSGNQDQEGFEVFSGYTQTPLANFANISQWTVDRPLTGKYNLGTHMVDLNGDGLQDIVQGLYEAASHNFSERITKRVWMNRRTHFEELPSSAPYRATWTGTNTAGLFSVLSREFPNANPGGDLGTRFIDLNADGLPDMFQLLNAADSANPSIPPNPSSQIRIYLNRGESLGWEELQGTHPWIAQINTQFGGIGTLHFSRTIRQDTYHHTSVSGGCQLADVNGDGYPDLILARHQVDGVFERVLLNKGPDPQSGGWQAGSAFETSLQALLGSGTWSQAYLAKNVGQTNKPKHWMSDTGFRIRDLNADGLPDLMVLTQGYSGSPDQRAVALNRGANLGFVPDSAFTQSLNQTNNAFFSQIRQGSDVHGKGTELVDLNSDGYPDLLTLFRELNGSVTQRLYWNTGKAFVSGNQLQFPADDVYFEYFSTEFADGGGTHSGGTRLVDINSDGLMDLVTMIHGRGAGSESGAPRQVVHQLVFQGNTLGWQRLDRSQSPWLESLPQDLYFSYVRPSGVPFGQYDMGVRFDDVNGDGRLDVVQLVQADTILNRQAFWLAKSATLSRLDQTLDTVTHLDKLQRINHGLGAVSECHYLPASIGNSLYVAGDLPSYPKRHSTPVQLLARITKHQTQAVVETTPPQVTQFHYVGNRYQLDIPGTNEPDGAGSLGFERIRLRDVQRKKDHYTYYRQDFPFTGRIFQTRQRNYTLNQNLGIQVSNYQRFDAIPGNQGKTYRIDLHQSWDYVYEGGQEVYRTFVSTFRDAFGNPYLVKDGGRYDLQGDERYIHRTFNNHPNLWLYGLPATLTHSTSSNPHASASWLNRKEFTYETGKPHRLAVETSRSLDSHADRVISFTYTPRGLLQTQTDPLGQTKSWTYDSRFRMYPVEERETIDGKVHLTSRDYDFKNGQVIAETNARGLTRETVFDGMGRIRETWVEAPNSNTLVLTSTTDYQFGNGNRGLTLVQKAIQDWNTPLATHHSKVSTLIDTWGRTVRKSLHDADDPLVRTTEYSFDAAGRLHRQTMPFNGAVANPQKFHRRSFFDEKDRVIRIEHPRADQGGLEMETYTYDAVPFQGRNLLATRHEGRREEGLNGQVTQTLYDARNQVLSRRYFETPTQFGDTLYSYDGMGRIQAIYSQETLTGQRIKTQPIYNGLGFKTELFEKVVLLDGTTETVLSQKHFQFAYNALGQMIRRTDPQNRVVEMAFDTYGRRDFQDLDPHNSGIAGALRWIDFEYEMTDPTQLGHLKSITGYADRTLNVPVFRYRMRYDKYDQVTYQSVHVEGLDPQVSQYAYRPDGQLLRLTYPDQSLLEIEHHTLGMVNQQTITFADGTSQILAEWDDFNLFGQPTTLIYGNGVATEYDFRPHDGRLEFLSIQNGNHQVMAEKEYRWEDRGLLEAIIDHHDPNLTQNFGYDDLRRLTSAEGVYGLRHYQYDSAGNMYQKGALDFQDFHGFEVAAVVDTGTGAAHYFDYDGSGNTVTETSDTLTHMYTYDPLDRMVVFEALDQNQSTALESYLYDHSGKRIRKMSSHGETIYYLFPHYEIVHKPGAPDSFTKYVSAYGQRVAQLTHKGPAADLAITDLQAIQLVDNRHEASVEISNLGTRTSIASQLKWGLSQSPPQFIPIPPLNPGESLTLSFSAISNPNQSLAVMADPDDTLEELDETNNQASLKLPYPDLALELVEKRLLDPTHYLVTILVKNQGTSASLSSCRVELMTSSGSYAFTVPSLAKDQKWQITATVDVNPARDELQMVVDSLKVISELDEDNNRLTEVLALPDLALSPVSLEFSPGKPPLLTLPVGNIGFEKAPAVIFQVSQLRDGRVINVVNGEIPALDPGANLTHQVSFTSLKPRDDFQAAINPAGPGRIQEMSYANNSQNFKALPDLAITQVRTVGLTCLEEIQVTMANLGNTHLNTIQVQVDIRTELNDPLVLSTLQGNLPPGSSQILKFPLPKNPKICQSASIRIQIDPNKTQPDINPDNNSQNQTWQSVAEGQVR